MVAVPIFVRRLLAKWYGDFNREELIRTLLLGAALALLVGTYWTLRPLKNALFKAFIIGEGEFQDASLLAWARILFIGVLIPLMLIYSRLADRFKKQDLLYVIGGAMAAVLLIFSFLFAHPTLGLANNIASPQRWVGWAWYACVEVYGSLMMALFWAYTTDSVDAEYAKKAFPMIVLCGQVGGVLCPQSTHLPAMLGFKSNAPLVAACAATTLAMLVVIRQFALRLGQSTGPVLVKDQTTQEGGFIEGLKILFKDRYLLGIFLIVAFFEMVVTIFDFNFKRLVFQSTVGHQATASLLGNYGSAVNAVSFLCLALGVGNVRRRLGMKTALCAMPLVLSVMFLGFKLNPSLSLLFWIMVFAEALNYALNVPALKQLYIPTSAAAKYKTQVWIDMLGSRGGRGVASGINTLFNFFRAHAGSAAGFTLYVTFAGVFSGSILACWIFIAFFLSREFDRKIAK